MAHLTYEQDRGEDRMFSRKSRHIIAGFVSLLLVVSSAHAHDVWITTVQEGSTVRAVINHGHPGDRKTPDPDKLFEFDLIRSDQSRQSLLPGIKSVIQGGIPVLQTASLSLTGDADVWLLAARYDNGFWVQTPHGYRNTSKRQITGVQDSLYSMKFAKALLQIGAHAAGLYQTRIGHRLELVPFSNPFLVRPGGSLKVQVFFDGKPLVGVGVEIGDGIAQIEEKDIRRYKTDEQGIAVLPITKLGPQLIVVDHILPSVHPDMAARELYNATLTFALSSTESP